jgi:hypothetical protein
MYGKEGKLNNADLIKEEHVHSERNITEYGNGHTGN